MSDPVEPPVAPPVEPPVAQPPAAVAPPAAPPAEPRPDPVEGAWPNDWRQRIAGEDADALKTLERFGEPAAIYKSYKELRKAIDSGVYKRGLPADASPELIAEWRRENGIPEAPDKYEIKLGNGIVPGESDKPVIDAFLAKAHATNMAPAQVNEAVSWYYEQVEAAQAAQAEADKAAVIAREDKLRAEYGPEYRSNLNRLNVFVREHLGDVADQIMLARLPDGTLFENHAESMMALVNLARAANPLGTIVPAQGQSALDALAAEKTTIEKRMREDRAGYNKDSAMQARYRELLEIEQRARARAA